MNAGIHRRLLESILPVLVVFTGAMPLRATGAPPPTISSAGWKRTFSVPANSESRIASITPTPIVAWASCPQACMASSNFERNPSATGRWSESVDSRRGRASISTRRPTVGPSPRWRTPITPVAPPEKASSRDAETPASRARSRQRSYSSASGTPCRASISSASLPTYICSTPITSSSSMMREVV